MPRPGTDIRIVDGAPAGGAVITTTQAFFVGSSERGPSDGVESVSSPADYEVKFGGRAGGSLLYDAVSTYFTEGGSALFVSRAIGSGSAQASGAFGSLTAKAASAGLWGNDIEVTAVEPALPVGDEIVVSVTLDDEEVERSYSVATADELVLWAQEHSGYVSFTKGADNVVPAVDVTAALTGGLDGSALDTTAITTALDRFGSSLGAGQVCAPGLTSPTVHEALLAHVEATRRCALLDLPDSDDPLELAAAVTALKGIDGVRFAAAFAPWAIYSGPAGAQVTVPYSAVQAALIAQSDRATGNPNQPAAGAAGIARGALGLSQEFTDAEREALNDAGVNMAKIVYGDVRTYGYRTAAGPADTSWVWFGNSRVVMAISHEADAAAEGYVLRQIDGRGHLFAGLHSDLTAICLRYFNAGALYGEHPEDAFLVDTGSQVNTIDTIKNGEVHAVIRLKCSPAAEWVVVSIVKVPVDASLTAAA